MLTVLILKIAHNQSQNNQDVFLAPGLQLKWSEQNKQ